MCVLVAERMDVIIIYNYIYHLGCYKAQVAFHCVKLQLTLPCDQLFNSVTYYKILLTPFKVKLF